MFQKKGYMTGRRGAYEDASTTFSRWAFTTEPLDLSIGVDLVVFQDRHLDLLALMLNLLGGLEGVVRQESASWTKVHQDCGHTL